jgi:hypothetical protein
MCLSFGLQVNGSSEDFWVMDGQSGNAKWQKASVYFPLSITGDKFQVNRKQ